MTGSVSTAEKNSSRKKRAQSTAPTDVQIFGSIVGLKEGDFYNHMNSAKKNNNDTGTHTAIFDELRAISKKYFTGEE